VVYNKPQITNAKTVGVPSCLLYPMSKDLLYFFIFEIKVEVVGLVCQFY
jgi:hypothetical protein